MKILNAIVGLVIGLINSLLGAGGGMVSVPYLNKNGLSQQKSQATSLLIILPLSIISTILYLKSGYLNFNDSLIFIIPGIIGAVIGGLTLKKIPNTALKIVFSAFMIYAGVRMIIK